MKTYYGMIIPLTVTVCAALIHMYFGMYETVPFAAKQIDGAPLNAQASHVLGAILGSVFLVYNVKLRNPDSDAD